MAYMMHATESGRPRRTINGLPRALATAAAVVGICLAGLGLTSCVDGSDDDYASETSIVPDTTGGLTSEEVERLAFAAFSGFAPPTDPGGSPYRNCTIEYGEIDWDGEPAAIVRSHTEASAVPCAGETWYHNTAFQNGILTFMALVGEEALAAAAPTSDGPTEVATSLRNQGFDRLAAIDIASSGRCERGQVQAALFTLKDRSQPVEGLQPLIESAQASGAEVEHNEQITFVSGGGAPCATAIVHSDGVLGWVTTMDVARLKLAVKSFDLTIES